MKAIGVGLEMKPLNDFGEASLVMRNGDAKSRKKFQNFFTTVRLVDPVGGYRSAEKLNTVRLHALAPVCPGRVAGTNTSPKTGRNFVTR